MAQSVIFVAQATTTSPAPADAVQNGTVVQEQAAAPAATGEVHETTEQAEHSPGFPPFDTSTFPSQLPWFAILFTGRHPRGMWDFLVKAQRYYLHLQAYMYLMTDAYPKYG